jgi:cytochrome c-type biogenesis protein
MANEPITVGLAILGGLVTVLSPCVLPILPILVGRSLQSHRLGPIAMVMGLIAGFAVAGSLLGFASSWVTGLANGLRQVAIALLILLGLTALFPQWSYKLWCSLPFGNLKEPVRIGLAGEFWVGTQLGLLWTPCAGPVLGGILILAAVQQQAATAFKLLVAYGLGAAIPLLAIAYGGRALGHKILTLRSATGILQRVGGVLILGTAIAILMGWDVQIQLWLAPFFPALPV